MANRRERSRADSAGVGPDPRYADDLVSIRDLHDFRIASGQADIRGWDVRTLAGRKVGDVDDLLIDTRRGEVVMIDVDIKDTDRHAEVPIRNVQIDRERKCVVIDSADLGVSEPMIDRGEPYIADRGVESPRSTERQSFEPARERFRDERESEEFDRTADRVARERAPETRTGMTREGEEIVVERRPLVEEVVVRRKPVDDDE